MSARPERKRSTLSGRNPIAPPPEAPQEPSVAAPAPAAPVAPVESVTEPQAAAPKKRSKPPELNDQVQTPLAARPWGFATTGRGKTPTPVSAARSLRKLGSDPLRVWML